MVALASSQQPGSPLGRVAEEWEGGHGLAGDSRRTLALLLFPHYLMPAEKLINLRCCFAALDQFLLYLNKSAHYQHTA